MTMPLDEDDVDKRLVRLRVAADAATSNLIELEDLGTLSLLRAGSYSGQSETPISRALRQINALNLHYRSFLSFVNELDDLRRDGRFTREKARQIERMLRSPSIDLPATEVELGHRDLFSPVERTERVNPDQLIEIMNREFVEAKAVVLEIDRIWHALLPELDRAQQRLADLRRRADALGEPIVDDRDIERRIEWCRAAITSDPLGAGRGVTADIGPALDQASQRLDDLAASRHDLAGQLALARQKLRSVTEALDESEHLWAEARRSITDPRGLLTVDREYLDDERSGLAPWLHRLDEMQGDGRWRDAQVGLARWEQRAEQVLATARQASNANRAPLSRRDELRGKLSAYEAAARRDGIADDAEIARLRDTAHESLFSEPADLDDAAARVREYQFAVRKRGSS